MRTRRIVFTYNNYPPEYNDDAALNAWLDSLGALYCIAGREVAPGTGTPHLQGYAQYVNPKSITAFRRLFMGCHVEPARGTGSQSRTYCSKDGSFCERGIPPTDENPGNREKQRWEDARSLAKEGKFDQIPADIYIRYIGNLHRIYREILPPLEPLPATCGRWLLGRTGSGKSKGVRSAFPLVYPKPLNKWWDGYDDHTHVLLDDVDHNQSSWIGNFLKIWSDHYPFIAEKKGGSRLIRPELIIVTSQYSIRELFNDNELVLALERRFQVINVNKDEPIEWV
ncbi:putative Rep protein [Circovirus-like genome DCCV-5]|uniref:Replication-associated protein n=1 Tax=Circovirus-like genome DCCV-5 TaxID=1788445 RepID=A0A190WHA3_9VIRU|nr:putative Rep protein [Circovirus-like genome DCCV-5]AMB42962.1 putative Rep protein [Circovirus-like genome DCCV-5]